MIRALDGVEVRGPVGGRAAAILTEDAVGFVARLHRAFEPVRARLLETRRDRQRDLLAGDLPDFLPATKHVRDADWRVAAIPGDLADRRVEITGPTDRKMVINALNSGARVFMADFEDANSPTWPNLMEGQGNLIDAVRRTISLETRDKTYRLGEEVATLMVRPRGWHLPEKHVAVDGELVSASLFDAGLFLFHNARELVDRGTGPYLYLPKLESHLEARLWNDVLSAAEGELGLSQGTIKATVLIETVLAAFEMDEILYELRDHCVGLNAGRWDYIFSIIKKFRNHPEWVLPDRAGVSMTVPFMRSYTELLVKTCHRRGAFAMGGMAAFVPSRRDPVINETAFERVRQDKERESADGFDGTWVAHPDLVPVAQGPFDRALGDRPNQLDRMREDVDVAGSDLLDIRVPDGAITEDGVRNNVSVAIQYLASWLSGNGAVAIFNLMEDAATAEIARSQVWQWLAHGALLDDGRLIDRDLVGDIEGQEAARIRDALGEKAYAAGGFERARELFQTVALSPEFAEFLTLPGYELLD